MKINRKISIFLTATIFLSILYINNNNIIYANEIDDRAIYTEIDENGDVKEVSKDEINQADIIETPSTFSLKSRSIVNQENILQKKGVVNFRTKTGEITEYTVADSGLEGYTNGSYAADAAYLGHNEDKTKVKFMLAGVIGWVDATQVQVLDFSNTAVQTLSKYYVKNGRLYHGIVTSLSSSSYASNIDVGPKPSYLNEGQSYYSYDGHYFYAYNNTNGYITMLSDYRNDTRQNSVNPNNPYYNYYQFLSHRSTTVYTADEINRVIKNKASSTSKMLNLGESFINNQNKYGINALLTLGVAANESSWGSSDFAQYRNNLFGHAAYDSDPNGNANSYSTPEFSVYYHTSTFLAKQYCYPENWKYHGTHLGDKSSGINVKYASDPYWGEKAAAVCWYVDQQLGSKDSKQYTIGIKDVYNYQYTKADIKNEANSSSTTLYSSTNGSNTLTSYPVIIIDKTLNNGYYKIRSDAPLNSSRTAIVKQEEYSFSNYYAYISNQNLFIVNSGTKVDVDMPTEPTYLKGDVDGDGSVEANDYMLIKLHVLGRKSLYDEKLNRADVDKDGAIEANDYMLIKLHVLGRQKLF